jgi:hypothetical protein
MREMSQVSRVILDVTMAAVLASTGHHQTINFRMRAAV